MMQLNNIYSKYRNTIIFICIPILFTGIGYIIRDNMTKRVISRAILEANEYKGKAEQLAEEGAKADGRFKELEAKAKAVEQDREALRRKLASQEHAYSSAHGTNSSGGLDPDPLLGQGSCDACLPVWEMYHTAKELIAVQDKELSMKQEMVQEMTASRDSYKSAYENEKRRGDILESAAKRAVNRSGWSSGVTYGSKGTRGAWVEYEIGRVKISTGVQVNAIQTETMVGVGWSF